MEQALDLPDDIDVLRALVLSLQDKVEHLENQKAHLQEHIRLLLHKRFGVNSEKYYANQADLFQRGGSLCRRRLFR